jgi:hypothetical protein
MTDSARRFAERAVRRKGLFLKLAMAGLIVAGGLSVYYGYRWLTDPAFGIGPRAVIVLLILLNSRQNLRQHRYAGVIESFMGSREPSARPEEDPPDSSNNLRYVQSD